MSPICFVVVLAAFLVQVSDAKAVDHDRVESLDQEIRDIQGKDHSSSKDKTKTTTNPAVASPGNFGDRLHSPFIFKKVKDDGFWSALWFINIRLIKSAMAWFRELFSMPFYIFRIIQYKALILFKKA